MTRRRFGGDLTAVAWAAEEVGGVSDVLTLARDAGGITAWDSRTGGAQVTDLTDLSDDPLPGGEITADSDGMFSFKGPDTDPPTVELWLDAGFGGRQLAVASDLGPDVAVAFAKAEAAEAAVESIGDDIAAALSDAPRFLIHDGSWPARAINGRMTFFVMGDVATDAPDDPNLTRGDVWIPEKEA